LLLDFDFMRSPSKTAMFEVLPQRCSYEATSAMVNVDRLVFPLAVAIMLICEVGI
jgi:hypothetical protein